VRCYLFLALAALPKASARGTKFSPTHPLQVRTSAHTFVRTSPASPVGNAEEQTLPDTSSWLRGEASIDDFMADPIVQLMMRSDRVSVGELRALLRTASEKLTRVSERASYAETEATLPQTLLNQALPCFPKQFAEIACITAEADVTDLNGYQARKARNELATTFAVALPGQETADPSVIKACSGLLDKRNT